MLVSRSRDKLINAILYFAERTRGLGKIKLLYLLDFEHFRQTGRPVTGMEYRAWKIGPVPAALVQIWDGLDADLGAGGSLSSGDASKNLKRRIDAGFQGFLPMRYCFRNSGGAYRRPAVSDS